MLNVNGYDDIRIKDSENSEVLKPTGTYGIIWWNKENKWCGAYLNSASDMLACFG